APAAAGLSATATADVIAADLKLFSAIVAALPESEGVAKDATDPGNIVWTGTNAFRNVFWVNADDFNLEYRGIWINVPAGSKIVVNVFGDTVTETYSDIYLPDGVDPSRVLFNFVDATSITTTGFEFHGSVLAPYADASFSGAAIDGFAYIGGNVQTANGFEFHDFEFKAFDCSRSIVTVNKPAIGVSLSANGYDVGQIVRVAEGGTLDIVQKVANTGRTSLENVVLVDVLGNRYDLGTLAAGESKTVTVSAPAAAGLSATATADVIAADGSAVPAYEGAKVSAAGSLKVQTLTAGELVAYETAKAMAEAAKLGYIPRPDFEVSSINFVNGSPTITGEVFSVVATIKNVGETAAHPGKVALYISHANIVEIGETPDAVKGTTSSLEPGQEMEIKFENVKAPGEGGPHHVRVLVDANGAVEELSEGNNQLPLFYFLNNIAVSIEIQGSTLILTWNSYEGQAYTVRAATALDAFEDYIPVGSDGLDNLGYFHMQATPPYNTAEIDLNGADARFFKIRVDNLADEVR
ncbi:MAG: choice-of-anchor A family protein, partial [Fibrobacterales bacterium]|nr:choice-of-anchor A family protein [Fibrobacterales bacterium]